MLHSIYFFLIFTKLGEKYALLEDISASARFSFSLLGHPSPLSHLLDMFKCIQLS